MIPIDILRRTRNRPNAADIVDVLLDEFQRCANEVGDRARFPTSLDDADPANAFVAATVLDRPAW